MRRLDTRLCSVCRSGRRRSPWGPGRTWVARAPVARARLGCGQACLVGCQLSRGCRPV